MPDLRKCHVGLKTINARCVKACNWSALEILRQEPKSPLLRTFRCGDILFDRRVSTDACMSWIIIFNDGSLRRGVPDREGLRKTPLS